MDFSQTPNMNPTGATGNGGITPPTGGAGNYGYGNMNPGPLGVQAQGSSPSGAPTVTANPGQPAGSTGSPNQFVTAGQTGNFDPSSNEFGWQLNQTYGTGLGSVLEQFLQSGGGYNLPLAQQTASAQEAAMQQAIQRGWGDQASHYAETGISPNSSTYALGQGDYYSNAVTQENAIMAQDFQSMWSQSQQNETSILGDIMNPLAQNKASRDSAWQSDLSLGLSLVGDVVGVGGLTGGLGGLTGGWGADTSGIDMGFDGN